MPPEDPYANIDLKSVRSKIQNRILDPQIGDSGATSHDQPDWFHRSIGLSDLSGSDDSKSVEYDEDFEDEFKIPDTPEEASIPPITAAAAVSEPDYLALAIDVINESMRDRLKELKERVKQHEECFDSSLKTRPRPSPVIALLSFSASNVINS